MTDSEYLQQFVRENSQTAFAALVDRHVGLVYSAALRQVRSPQLAEEIAQSVFLDLSRRAAQLDPAQPLAAWLYLVTRRTAVDVIRRESRRQARERTAAEIAVMKETPPHAWAHVERSLDDAMETLNETERTAILLRYFKNLTLREVGESLGISEDTAQKRVSRAVEQLRTFFLQRGVTVTAAGLATDLSAHAVQIAPVSLGATISTATALTTVGTTAALETSRVVAMTTLQKSLAAAIFVAISSAGIFQAAAYVRQDSSLALLQAQSTALQRDVGTTRVAHEMLIRRLGEVESQIDVRLAQARRAPPPTDPQLEGTLATWLARANRLQAFIATRPDLAIPELRLLSSDDWAEIASKSPPGVDAGSDTAIKEALALARKTAEQLFAPQLQRALKGYLQASGGILPDSLYQLLPHFDSPIAPALLSRYQLLQTGKLADLPMMDQINWLIETRDVIDLDQDNFVSIGTSGRATHSAKSPYARAQSRKATQVSKP